MPNVTVGKHYEILAEGLVESGRYASVSEVYQEGLRLVEERERTQATKLDALRQLIDEGDASGDAEPLDMASIKAEGLAALEARKA